MDGEDKKNILLARNAIVGGASALFFIISLFVLHFGVIMSVLLSIALYFALMMFLFPDKDKQAERKKREKQKFELKQKFTKWSLEADKILEKKYEITNSEVKNTVYEISGLIKKIIEVLKENPDDVSLSEQFMNYYLDSTVKIVNSYVSISNKKMSSSEIEHSLKRVEKALNNLRATFQKQLDKIISQDLSELNTDISVLEKVMEMDKDIIS